MSLEQDDVIKIIKLMDASNYDELHLEMGDLKLSIAKSGTGVLSSIKESASLSTGEPRRSSTISTSEAVQAHARTESTSTGNARQPMAPVQVAAADGLIPIQSPLLGIFYRSPKPEAPPFVEVGSNVTKGDTVCLIEVMKTFTTVKSVVEGRIAKICAENAQMVEYQQTLFLVEPERSSGR